MSTRRDGMTDTLAVKKLKHPIGEHELLRQVSQQESSGCDQSLSRCTARANMPSLKACPETAHEFEWSPVVVRSAADESTVSIRGLPVLPDLVVHD